MKPTRIIASAMLLAFVSSIISTTNYSLQGLWVQSLAAQNITQIDDSKPIDAEEVEPEEEKRLVVCIDQAVDEEGNPVEDGALNNAEGYWRAVMAERNNRDDVISVGGSLADCLDMVESEDCVQVDSCVGVGQLKITLPPNVADESDEKGYVPPVDTSDQN